MRRPSALFLLCLLPTLARAQTSATAPTFHAGQWAAEFSLGSFSGIGALHFSTPTKAWTLSALVRGILVDASGSSNSSNYQDLALNVGRRWYRPASGRVRPFTSLGLNGHFDRTYQKGGVNDATNRTYGAGIFGQLGAAVFFAPELSLGATWGAQLGVDRLHYYTNGVLQSEYTQVTFNAGYLSLQGAFYF